ncbi:hypothetical protein DSO57_1032116 [Entomophthora muscae]|uniref:Uncharacterized protein n=1 Tax=Entomophthora muscae TaxID=34485 RepID=A0ACC2SPS6_9FUNG|nr:hypothetical protein DSO57_1032116 [Entomophthora muscae]
MVLALVSGENLVKLDPSSTERPLKVLVSMTFGSRSHIKNIFEIGKTLQKRGHKLSYMAIEPYLRFADGYNVTRHQLGPSGIEVDDHRGISELNQVPVNPLLDTLDALIEHLPIIYRMTLKDVLDVIDLEKPDVMICDFFSPSCIDGAHQRKIPLITGLQTLDGPILPPPTSLASSPTSPRPSRASTSSNASTPPPCIPSWPSPDTSPSTQRSTLNAPCLASPPPLLSM